MSMTNLPLLVMIDIQNEYVTPGRPFHLAGIQPSLARALELLGHARAAGWPIIHVQHLQGGAVFNHADPLSGFVDGFEPLQGERVITKAKLSAFSNPDFEAAVREHEGDVLVAGYGSTMCCLATIVDAALYGRKLTFVHDASWARSPGPTFTEAETHRHATAIIGIHGKLASVAEVATLATAQAA